MAATRLIPLHLNKGQTLLKTLKSRIDYAVNPEKTENGNLVTAYGCDPFTAVEDFVLSHRQYQNMADQQNVSSSSAGSQEIVAYQIRQSFKPGEVTPEEANQIGQELALKFTNGNHSFIVATHTDRAHIHNHIIFNAAPINGTKKFRNFYLSSFALQRTSDLLCINHGLSVITPSPYNERDKRGKKAESPSKRDFIRNDIDSILKNSPQNFSDFLEQLQDAGYEIKYGKHIAIRRNDQKRFVRLESLGGQYSENVIRLEIRGIMIHKSRFNKFHRQPDDEGTLIRIVDNRLNRNSPGYKKWASKQNINAMAKTRLYMRDHNISDLQALTEMRDKTFEEYRKVSEELSQASRMLKKLKEQKSQLSTFIRYRNVFQDYKSSGYNPKFKQEHLAELEKYNQARGYFQENGFERYPKMKELNEAISQIYQRKHELYDDFTTLKKESKNLAIAVENVREILRIPETYDSHKMKSKEKINPQEL